MTDITSMKNLKQQIAELQKERINEIVNDSSITKLEKLKMLEDERLFGFDPFFSNPFKEYAKELELIVNEKHDIICSRINDIFSGSLERYHDVSFADFFEDYFYHNDPTTLYPICESQYTDDKIFKTKDEIIDIIFNHCLENKIVGFRFDW